MWKLEIFIGTHVGSMKNVKIIIIAIKEDPMKWAINIVNFVQVLKRIKLLQNVNRNLLFLLLYSIKAAKENGNISFKS